MVGSAHARVSPQVEKVEHHAVELVPAVDDEQIARRAHHRPRHRLRRVPTVRDETAGEAPGQVGERGLGVRHGKEVERLEVDLRAGGEQDGGGVARVEAYLALPSTADALARVSGGSRWVLSVLCQRGGSSPPS